MKNVKECEEYLLNIPKFKKKTLLSDTKRFYEMLGNPGIDIPVIHVAGTNGKGSTCFYISEILKAHGLKTGLFTSPHLVSMKERFVIDGAEINDDDFIEAFEKVLDKCNSFDEKEKMTLHPSFFEYLFLMFMEWAGKQHPDVIVLETGLGGMLDATNIFDKPALSVICSIGLDHIEQLGDTIESIAEQKAGIIKDNVDLVFWDNGETVNNILQKTAENRHSKTYLLSEKNISLKSVLEKQIDFSLDFEYDKTVFVHDLSVSLKTGAFYQHINASMAVLASKVFLKDDFDSNKAKKALEKKSFRGRLEEIHPGFYTDGAHNPDAVDRLLESLSKRNEKRTLIFGACVDKDYKTMLEKIVSSNLFDRIIFTKADSPRSEKPENLYDSVVSDKNLSLSKPNQKDLYKTNSLRDAIEKSKEFGNVVYIAGSLYLVGEALKVFGAK